MFTLFGCLCLYYTIRRTHLLSHELQPLGSEHVYASMCVNLGVGIRLRGCRGCESSRVWKLSWISDDMITQETPLWDLAVSQCNERKSGRAPVASAMLHSEVEWESEGYRWVKGSAGWKVEARSNNKTTKYPEQTKPISASRRRFTEQVVLN